MNKKITFKVLGTSDIYIVEFFLNDKGNLLAHCNCVAGQNHTHCKHRLDIFSGNTSAIESDNKEEVEQVLKWLKGSSIEDVLKKIQEEERQKAKIMKDIKSHKKQLARIMFYG
jgi:hypothetical protein